LELCTLFASFLLGAFVKFSKSGYYLRHIYLFVRMEHLGPHWTEFHEIRYLIIFGKSVEKIQDYLKPDKQNG